MSEQVNLFNPLFRRRELRLSGFNLVPAALATLLLSLLYWQWMGKEDEVLRATRERNVKTLAAAQERVQKLSPHLGPEERAKLLAGQIRQAEEKLALTQVVLAQLEGGSLGNTTGYSENLRAFARQIGDGVWLTGFSLAGRDANIRGGALRPELLPAYMQRLSQEKSFQGQSFSALDMAGPAKPGQPDPAQPAGGKAGPAGYLAFELSSRPIERKESGAAPGTPAPASNAERLLEFNQALAEIGQQNKIRDAKAMTAGKVEEMKLPDLKLPELLSGGAPR